jgi:DNA integrity scanning protein DisA with diadenylate cyclase activity
MKAKIESYRDSVNKVYSKLTTKKLGDLMTFSDIFRIYAGKNVFPLIRFYIGGRQIEISKGLGREKIITKNES